MSTKTFMANHAGTIGSIAGIGANAYLQIEEAKRRNAMLQDQIDQSISLTASLITIEREQTLAASREVGEQVRKQQVQILRQERAAEGAAVVAASQVGATGRRVSLARAQAIEGVAGDALSELADLSEREQEKLIDQSRFMTRKHMAELINSAPITSDAPGIAELSLPGIASGIEAARSDAKFRQGRKENIVQITKNTATPGVSNG